MNTKTKNILAGVLAIVPSLSHADTPETINQPVPFSHIYETVQQHPALYNSDFVFFLENQITDNKYTLGNLAQTCINYTQHNNAVTHEICTEFIDSIIGSTILTDLNKTFVATTTSDTDKFEFDITAAGNFTVDCGDESEVQKIKKDTIDTQTITCDYSTPGEYKIIIGGRATDYATNEAAISIPFLYSNKLTRIEGSLGAIFPTLGNKQPIFAKTFYGCRNLTGPIPENLFAGIKDAPAKDMFDGTFSGCSKLSGPIPANLFAGIKGAPAESMFAGTFYGCSKLSGPIPENLFAGIDGAPAVSMFWSTFDGCSGLTGSIPENLFKGIKGTPAKDMFADTFSGCSNLTGSIPENLFKGIKGAPAKSMFADTFFGCSKLSGPIPENLFAGIDGAPAVSMFDGTFSGCSNLTGSIPKNLFAGIKGAPKYGMFNHTFNGCSGLTGPIPENLFAGIEDVLKFGMLGTFDGCNSLTGTVGPEFFGSILSEPIESWQAEQLFGNNSGITFKQ